jgi:hypothetical protein
MMRTHPPKNAALVIDVMRILLVNAVSRQKGNKFMVYFLLDSFIYVYEITFINSRDKREPFFGCGKDKADYICFLTVGIPEIWELHYHKNLRSGPKNFHSLLSV